MSTKLSSHVQEVINNVVVCVGLRGGGSGDGGGCLGLVVQALFGRSRAVPCGVAGALAGMLRI